MFFFRLFYIPLFFTLVSSSLPESQRIKHQITSLVKEALEDSNITARLPSDSLAILKTFVTYRETYCAEISIQYVAETYPFQQLDSNKHDPIFWHSLSNHLFHHLAHHKERAAKIILNSYIIPSHSFCQELQGRPTLDAFIAEQRLTPTSLLDSILGDIFDQKMLTLLAYTTPSDLQSEAFQELLTKYKRAVSWDSQEEAYACDVLISLGLESVSRSSRRLPEKFNQFYLEISYFADTICNELADASKVEAQEVQRTLESIFPIVYGSLHEKTYQAAVIYACLRDAAKPSDSQKLEEISKVIHSALLNVYHSLLQKTHEAATDACLRNAANSSDSQKLKEEISEATQSAFADVYDSLNQNIHQAATDACLIDTTNASDLQKLKEEIAKAIQSALPSVHRSLQEKIHQAVINACRRDAGESSDEQAFEREIAGAIHSAFADVHHSLHQNTYQAAMLQGFKHRISKVIQTDEISNCMSLVYHSILSAFHQDLEYSRKFFAFVSEEYAPDEHIYFNWRDPESWNFLIYDSFRQFAETCAEQAELFVQSLLASADPFLSSLDYSFSIDSFIHQRDKRLDIFLTAAAKDLFIEKTLQITNTPQPTDTQQQPTDAQHQLRSLLRSLSHSPLFCEHHSKYHIFFLMNLELRDFQKAATELFDDERKKPNDWNSALEKVSILPLIKAIAKNAYSQMHYGFCESAKRAQCALRSVQRQIYDQTLNKDYDHIIHAYVKSGKEPSDPEELRASIERALEVSQGALHHQISQILMDLHKGLNSTSRLFDFIWHNYQPYKLESKDLPFFWHSLIFSSIHSFAQAFPDLAEELTNEPIVPFDPFSTELPVQTPIFSEGLASFADLEGCWRNAVSWGHTHTVKLLTNFKTHAGWALGDAVFNCHEDVIKLLFQMCPEITGFGVAMLALGRAVSNGRKDIVELLFEMRPNIPANETGKVLTDLAKNNGRKDIAELLFKMHPKINEHYVKEALVCVAFYGHKDLFEFLLEMQPTISPEHVKTAFLRAAENGHKEIVEFLLTGSRVTVDWIEKARLKAVTNGHKDVVVLLV